MGLSLVELVVVIAIMAVLTGGSISIMMALNNAKVKSCAQSIYTGLGRVKTNTLAKEMNPGAKKTYYSLSKADSSSPVMAKEVVNGTEIEKNIGAKEITVYYEKGGGSSNALGSAEVKCYFDRSTGAVRSDISDFDRIVVSGAHMSYEIKIYKSTGKLEMNRL